MSEITPEAIATAAADCRRWRSFTLDGVAKLIEALAVERDELTTRLSAILSDTNPRAAVSVPEGTSP